MKFSSSQVTLLTVAGLTVSACAGIQGEAGITQAQGTSTERPNDVLVKSTSFSHVFHFAEGSDLLSSAERATFDHFLGDEESANGHEVLLERSASIGDDNRVALLVLDLNRRGWRPSIKSALIEPGSVQVTYQKLVASVPGCPNWTKLPGSDSSNTMPSDFGCATASNLAAMIVDPQDLIRGQSLSPLIGDSAILALRRYHEGNSSHPTGDSASGGSSNAAQTPTEPRL